MASFGPLPLTCQVCNKTFSGQAPAQQHFSSAEHKKRERNAKTQAHSRFLCKVCNKSCDTLKILEAHNQSPRHNAELEKQRRLQAPGHVIFSQNSGHSTNNDHDTAKEYVFDGTRGFCYICDLDLTSRSHAQDHLKGQKHEKKKKQRDLIPKSNFFPNPEPVAQVDRRDIGDQNISSTKCSPLFCDLCQVPFTGPENATQHYSSNNHKKKLDMARLAEKGELLPLKCDFCDCSFTGQESARSHFNSPKHKRNMDNQKIKGFDISAANTTDDQKIAVDPDPRRLLGNWGIGKVSTQERPAPVNTEPTNPDVDRVTARMSNVNLHSQTGLESCQYLTKRREVEETDESIIKAFPADEVSPPAEHTQPPSTMGYLKADPNTDCDNNAKCFSSPKDHATRNMYERSISENDEKKIQVETHPSLSEGSSLSSILSSEASTEAPNSFSQSDEPVRFIRNNLKSPSKLNPNQSAAMPLIGRGRAFSELKNNNSVIGRLLEKNSQSEASQNNLQGQGQGQTGGQAEVDEQNDIIKPVDQFQDYKLSERQTMSKDGSGDGFVDSPSSADSQPGFFVSGPVGSATNAPRPFSQSSRPIPKTGHYSQGVGTSDLEIPGGPPPGISRSDLPMQVLTSESQMHRPYQESSKLEEFTFDRCTCRGRCHVCNIELTSTNHMSQHIAGKKHTSAAAVWRAARTGSPAVVASPLVCTICCVNFSGFESRQQHMESRGHLQKEQQARGAIQSYHCDICNITCSGEASFQQHLQGSAHIKKAGLLSGMAVPGAGYDRTVWYSCDVCGCKVNSFGQLEIHQRSHAPKLNPEVVPNREFGVAMSALNPDKTMWYRCDVCMCNLNSESQLRIHQQSPAHLKKIGVRSAPQTSPFRPEHDIPIRPGLTSLSAHNQSGELTPLQSFLSEELFPEEFMPKTDDGDADPAGTYTQPAQSGAQPTHTCSQPFNLVVSDTPVPYQERYVAPGSSNDISSTQDHEPLGQGGSKRSQGSDLAFATRSRGSADRAPHHKDQSDINGSGTRFDLGARPKDTWNSGQGMVNPYAATHSFYCHTCKRPMNTQESYENHIRGKHHMQKVSTEPAPRRYHMNPVPLPVGYVPIVATPPRGYQRELYFKAIQGDALCFLPTGTGKTLVSVLAMAAMLEHQPSRSVLFLVDKVLLVLQQAQYIREQLQHATFNRYNPDCEVMDEVCRRPLQVAAVCMGQQNTGGVPLWKHDVIVVTAAFCQNLLDKEILRWEDFSLVVFDEAHHCEKSHPFNSLLRTFHNPVALTSTHRPKILGLTASPAGKADIPKTLQMLESLILNMGGVSMAVVEKPENVVQLKEYQSNAQMIIKTLSSEESSVSLESSRPVQTFKHELEVYILYCSLMLLQVSNVRNYVDMKGLHVGMSEADVRRLAGEFVEKSFDTFQSCLSWLSSVTAEQPMEKVSFSLLTQHMAGVCRALSSLLEGGPLCMFEDIVELQTSQCDFNLARDLGLPCDTLLDLVNNHGNEEMAYDNHGNNGGRDGALPGLSELIRVLAEGGAGQTGGERGRSISLVLVKQRSTAHRLTKILESSPELLRLGLQTATVVGHGGGGSTDRGMNVKQQKRVLEDIKQYKYQIIVATSVAEEGVDWPECERVISLYPPSTVTALVQMRGRARRLYSQFVIMCASHAEEDKLRDIINREQNMIAATKILVERSRKQ